MKKFLLILKDTVRSKNSLLVIFSVAFAVLMPIVIFSTSNSFMQAANEECNKIYGYFDNILYKADESSSVEGIRENATSSGFIKIFQSLNDDIVVGYIDDTAAELGNIRLISGEYPQNDNEIIVCNSLIYKNDTYNIGSIVTVGNADFRIVGIINDYYAVWNKPAESGDILFPNVLVTEKASKNYPYVIQEHLLTVNAASFSQDVYRNNDTLISNVNKTTYNESGKYEVPIFVTVLTTLCSVLLNLYIFSYYFESEKKKVAILRCFGLDKNQSIKYCMTKVSVLLTVAVPLGVAVGYAFSFAAIRCFSLALDLNYTFSFSLKYLVIGILLCLVAVAFSSAIALGEIKKVSPMDLYRNYNGKTVCKRSSDKIKKNGIFRLAFSELKLHLRESIIIIVLVSFSLALFTTLSLYMNVYSSKVSDVQGRMPLTFDYEFLTEQYISDMSYVNDKGQVVNFKNIPDDTSVYYLMDHNKIISNELIEEIGNESSVESVNRYLEANDLFLLNAPTESGNEYLTAYINDEILPDELYSAFDISGNARGIQYFGYSEKELLEMEQYVVEGRIDIEKIRSGEEAVLMVPMYEYKQYDGYSEQHFITQNEYTGEGNQYKDNTYSVGDTISFIQFYSKDENLKGYLNSEQLVNNIDYASFTVKIGAIITQRVAWFDNLSQPPTAYTLMGLNESISNLNILPTVSRVQIFLKNTTTFEEFDPIIQYYQNELKDYSFRNNAAEMQDYKEFQLIINTLCYSLIAIICLVVICILITEDKITLYRNKKFYALLHLNGLNYSGIKKMLVFRALIVAVFGIIFSLIISCLIMYLFFGGINGALRYIDLFEILVPIVILFVTILCSPLLSARQLNKTPIIQQITV